MAEGAPPHLFDRPLARARLGRALRQGPADFLLRRVALDLVDRLSAVNRRFEAMLDLGSPGSDIVAALSALSPTFLIQAAPISAVLGQGAWARVIADEERSPFASECFDLIVSGLALQGVNDLPGALAQIRRSLRPDGLFVGCLVGGRSLHELRAAFTQAEAEITGGASPRVAPFIDLRDAGALLQRAGFALPVADVDTLIVRYDSLFALARDLRAMGAANVLLSRSRAPLRRGVALRAADIYAERFADLDGRVRATFELVWLSGWAPHESQQKPLRPGSAQMRLADAIGRQAPKL